jgi:ribonuclease G
VDKELFINTGSDNVRIALLEDKRLVELHDEKPNSSFAVGDLYLGKVKKLVPGLNAAFVDVGYEKDAFLHYLDLSPQLRSLQKWVQITLKGKNSTPFLDKFELEAEINKEGNINEVLVSGQEILVQVAKEPISTKGPRITCEISLAGRFLVLVPFMDKISVSQKVRNKTERARLRNLIESIRPAKMGVIIRTVAENKKVAELDTDLKNLVKKWETLYQQLQDTSPPKRVLGEINRSTAILRDLLNPSFNSIVVDDPIIYDQTHEYLSTIAPEKVEILKQHKAKVPLFDTFGIEKQIKGLFGRTVTMPSGAYLIIEHTEALHVIDVNSGNTAKSGDNQESNALRVNIDAAAEIARQLRLRDMGGIIVIDFIDLRKPENRKDLMTNLREFMKNDKAKHHILPPSKFGLVQITRQRVRPELAIKTTEQIPTENGMQEVKATILIIDDIKHALDRIMLTAKPKIVRLHCHPFVAAYLKSDFRTIQRAWYFKHNKWVKIYAVDSLPLMKFQFFDDKDRELEF